MTMSAAQAREFISRRVGRGARVVLVAAADDAWGIGADGALPWRCPEDLRHFRQRTLGRTLVMGRRTVESLPAPLDGRRILAVSRSAPGPMSSVETAVALALAGSDEAVVAGGGEIYRAALELCTSAEVTRIKGLHACDAFMPDLAAAGWHVTARQPLSENATIEHWERPR